LLVAAYYERTGHPAAAEFYRELAARKQAQAIADKKEADKQKDKAGGEKAERQRLRDEVKVLRRRLSEMQYKAAVADLAARAMQAEGERLKELKRKRREIDGVLTKVDGARSRVSLTLGDTELALDGVALSGSAKFHLDGKECMAGDLKPGMRVSLSIAQEGGKAVATAVKARKPEKE
jgi:hypothetical protein